MIEPMADDAAAPADVEDVLAQVSGNVVDLVAHLRWLWLVVAVVAIGRLVQMIYERRRLARSGIREIDTMDGPTFEGYLGTMFRRLGYEVERVGSSRGDDGGDLVIRKSGSRTVVQAKRYGGKRVGIKAVQEANAARAMYRCAEAMVVTNTAFTQQAEALAQVAGVELVGREELIRALLDARASVEPVEADLAPAVAGDGAG
jgi:restriction system protein